MENECLSKGKKRKYLCPDCKSPDIVKEQHKTFGSICSCNSCKSWGPWSQRLSIKNIVESK